MTLAEASCKWELPVATIFIETPFCVGCTEAVKIEKPGVDQLIGNKAKCPDESVIDVPVYRVKSEVAVVTREQNR